MCRALVQSCPYNGRGHCVEGRVSFWPADGLDDSLCSSAWSQRWCSFGSRCIRWNAVAAAVLVRLEVCLGWIPLSVAPAAAAAAASAHTQPKTMHSLAQDAYFRLLSLMETAVRHYRVQTRRFSVNGDGDSMYECEVAETMIRTICRSLCQQFTEVVDGLVARFINADIVENVPSHKARLRLLTIVSAHYGTCENLAFRERRGATCIQPIMTGLHSVVVRAAEAKTGQRMAAASVNTPTPIEIESSSALAVMHCLRLLGGARSRNAMCGAALHALTAMSDAAIGLLPTAARDEARSIYEELSRVWPGGGGERKSAGQAQRRWRVARTYPRAPAESVIDAADGGGWSGRFVSTTCMLDSLLAPMDPIANINCPHHSFLPGATGAFGSREVVIVPEVDEVQLTGSSDPILALAAYSVRSIGGKCSVALFFRLCNQTSVTLTNVVLSVGVYGPILTPTANMTRVGSLHPGQRFDWSTMVHIVESTAWGGVGDDAPSYKDHSRRIDCSLWRRSIRLSILCGTTPGGCSHGCNVPFNVDLLPSAHDGEGVGVGGCLQESAHVVTTHPSALTIICGALELPPVMFLQKAGCSTMSVAAFSDVWRSLCFSRSVQLSCQGTRAAVTRALSKSSAVDGGYFARVYISSCEKYAGAGNGPIFLGALAQTWAGSYVAVWIVCVASSDDGWAVDATYRSDNQFALAYVDDTGAWSGAFFDGDNDVSLLVSHPNCSAGSAEQENTLLSFERKPAPNRTKCAESGPGKLPPGGSRIDAPPLLRPGNVHYVAPDDARNTSVAARAGANPENDATRDSLTAWRIMNGLISNACEPSVDDSIEDLLADLR